MLGIDWSHTRDFAVHDGKESAILPLDKMLVRAKEDGVVAIEAGAPVSVLYRLTRLCRVFLVSPFAVAQERERQGLPKRKSGIEDDLADAGIIWTLGQQPGLAPLTLADDRLRLARLYHEYLYALKAYKADGQLQKAIKRHFGDIESGTAFLVSQQAGDMEMRAEALKKEIVLFAPKAPASLLRIKGFSEWLWAGIVITADPRLFPTKQAYRTYCGLIDRKTNNHKFSRAARYVYWLAVDQFIKQNTPGYRELYDQAKEKLAAREGYTHPHGGAHNRVATAFANHVWDKVREHGVAQQGELFGAGG